MTIQTPQAPEGYFFRVRQAHSESMRHDVVFVELRRKTLFGSKVFEFHSASIRGGEHAIRDTMQQLIWEYESYLTKDAEADTHANRFVGDYPPKQLGQE